jgi:hypothetical protein
MMSQARGRSAARLMGPTERTWPVSDSAQLGHDLGDESLDGRLGPLRRHAGQQT